MVRCWSCRPEAEAAVVLGGGSGEGLDELRSRSLVGFTGLCGIRATSPGLIGPGWSFIHGLL